AATGAFAAKVDDAPAPAKPLTLKDVRGKRPAEDAGQRPTRKPRGQIRAWRAMTNCTVIRSPHRLGRATWPARWGRAPWRRAFGGGNWPFHLQQGPRPRTGFSPACFADVPCPR